MKWKDLPNRCKAYLALVYVLAIPFAFLCFRSKGEYGLVWILFTFASLCVATIALHLPQTPSVVVSMGDVFTILALVYFGPGPALLTYWANALATAITNKVKKHGVRQLNKITFHKLLFNLSCCALSIFAMNGVYGFATDFFRSLPGSPALVLSCIALVWFFVNSGAVSLAIALSTTRSFIQIWKEGVKLYVLNFFGSAAAAGLISQFYERAGFSVFLLSLPLVVVIYQLYVFYIEKYLEARKHIDELNKLYLQTIEAMANAVDAKDRYTHGHIRRVQALAVGLAKCIGIEEEQNLMAIKAGALLHDIGKIAIPEYILNKPTTLTESEYEKMKIHPVVGANILRNIDFPYPVEPLVKSHHERWDGNGYPEGLKEEQIPLNARILSLVDCYDALTTNRPYRSPMMRPQIIEFFQRESGRAYDPEVVKVFVANIEQMESIGKAVPISDDDLWGLKEPNRGRPNASRQLERVQPTVTYSKALASGPAIQRELYSVFELVQAEFQCLTAKEIFSFIGAKLKKLVEFDTGIFYIADLTGGVVIAEHVVGSDEELHGLTLALEQKLTGWVAANNQALCNLPPFPDFLKCGDPRPNFQLSAIAPLNRHGEVLGAISLYRKNATKFTEEEFRRLEIIASQTAILLAKCFKGADESSLLLDSVTGLPNGFQLYLMFEQIVMDATRYEYPLALFSIQFDDAKGIRKKWGPLSGDEAIRATGKYLSEELRETDLLVRYAGDEFIAVSPKLTLDQAETLKSRLQNDLDHFQFAIRVDVEIPLRVSIGIAMYPADGVDLEALMSVAEWRMREDRELRAAVRRRVTRI